MKYLLSGLVSLTLIAIGVPTMADNNRTISVSGQGEVVVVPDMATMSMSVNLRGAELDDLAKQMDAVMANLISKLDALDIDKKDINATQVNFYPMFEQKNRNSLTDTNNPTKLIGYNASRNINVTLRKLGDYPELLQTAVASGINQFGGVQLASSEQQQLERTALQSAVADARARAESIAEAAGVKITQVISVKEGVESSPGPVYRARAMAADSGSYEPGSMGISAQVSVVFGVE